MGMNHDHDHEHEHAVAHARWASGVRGGPLRVGIGGPVGTGKTELVSCLCRAFADELSLVCVTNDVFTTEDAGILERKGVIDAERIVGVETGCCPHTAIRDDISENLDVIEGLEQKFEPDLVLLESGGDNLTATFSKALVDVQIFVLDVAGGDKVPRKGGPGITTSARLKVAVRLSPPLSRRSRSGSNRRSRSSRASRFSLMSSRIAVCGQHPVCTLTMRSGASTSLRCRIAASSRVKMSLVTTASESSAASERHRHDTSSVLPLPTGPPMPTRSAVPVARCRWGSSWSWSWNAPMASSFR